MKYSINKVEAPSDTITIMLDDARGSARFAEVTLAELVECWMNAHYPLPKDSNINS